MMWIQTERGPGGAVAWSARGLTLVWEAPGAAVCQRLWPGELGPAVTGPIMTEREARAEAKAWLRSQDTTSRGR